MSERKKLCERVTVCLDEDDVRDLDLLVREDAERHNGRGSPPSIVIRDLIRERIAHLRARDARVPSAGAALRLDGDERST